MWSLGQRQYFIDSLLQKFDIPKLYLRKINNENYDWEVVDGQQRLRAIWDYLDGQYKLSDDSDPVSKHPVSGKFYGQLHPDVIDQLQAYPLSIVILKGTDDQIDEMFVRLQNGTALNSAEKRNAISGGVRDFVAEFAKSSKLLTNSVSFQNKRYDHDEVIAQMLLIEKNGGPTKIRHIQLKNMYEEGKKFKKSSREGAKLKQVLNFLSKAFPNKTPELSKVNVLSLYIICSESISKYAIGKHPKLFGEWFLDFERRRREEQEKDEDERENPMVSYQLAINQQTADATSQKTRRDVLMVDMLTSIPNLKMLDNRRQFSEDQRKVIFRKADGKCVSCEKSCLWDDFHADHIIPHSAGGSTTVENGQLLCPKCNIEKSDTEPT